MTTALLEESSANGPAGAPRTGEAAGHCADIEEPDYRFESHRDLLYVRGYVVNRRTGEVLSSVIADVQDEHRSRSR